MKKPHIRERITKQQYDDLYHRRRPVKEIAKELGVTPNYLSNNIKERAPKRNSTLLKATRLLFRQQIAKETLQGRHTVADAANLAHVSERTMYRIIARVRNVQ